MVYCTSKTKKNRLRSHLSVIIAFVSWLTNVFYSNRMGQYFSTTFCCVIMSIESVDYVCAFFVQLSDFKLSLKFKMVILKVESTYIFDNEFWDNLPTATIKYIDFAYFRRVKFK